MVLSGDLYHFRFSTAAQRRVPVFNVDADQTLAAMDKVEALVTEDRRRSFGLSMTWRYLRR